jgi:glycosyltransferase involved in cell wall biosynthesis
MKVAFVTDEYTSTHPRSGGLATYVRKIAALLNNAGHSVHIFVPSEEPRDFLEEGIFIHEVASGSTFLFRVGELAKRSWRARMLDLDKVLQELDTSLSICRAVQRHEAIHGPFAWVQSADFQFRGLFLSKRQRPHIVRCSWARDLFQRIDGTADMPINRMSAWLERLAIRRATVAYAPSDLVSRHYHQAFGLELAVIRPPLSDSISDGPTLGRPIRKGGYLVHFGQMCARKGSDLVLAAAGLLAQQGTPVDLRLAGADGEQLIARSVLPEGTRYLGALTRREITSLVAEAAACVLPSRVDNLPNTAIESLALGTPVIATRNSSIDELITDGSNGSLVPQENVVLLAQAMRRAVEYPQSGGVEQHSLAVGRVFDEMRPSTALERLLSFAAALRDTSP